MIIRMIFAGLLILTATAHAQIAGAGGASSDAIAKATQRRPTATKPAEAPSVLKARPADTKPAARPARSGKLPAPAAVKGR